MKKSRPLLANHIMTMVKIPIIASSKATKAPLEAPSSPKALASGILYIGCTLSPIRIVDKNMKSPTYGQVTSVVILSPGENFPTDGSEEKEAFIRDVIIEDPGIGYEDAEISDDIRPIIQNGRIAAIEIVEQIPYNRLPDLSVTSDTGYGAIIRPILSTERDERRTDPTQAGVFKVVQCVGAFSSETVEQQEITPDVVREIEETSTSSVCVPTVLSSMPVLGCFFGRS